MQNNNDELPRALVDLATLELWTVCEALGVDTADAVSASRVEHLVFLRCIVAHRCTEQGVPYWVTARVLQRDRSQVGRYLDTFDDLTAQRHPRFALMLATVRNVCAKQGNDDAPTS